jgi:hypothetical protein
MQVLDVVIEKKWIPHKDAIGEDFKVIIKTKDNKVIMEGSLSLSFRKSDITHYLGIKDIEELEKVVVDVTFGKAKSENPNIELKVAS